MKKENSTWRLIAFFLLIVAVLLLWKACFKKQEQVVKVERTVELLRDTFYKYRDLAQNEHAQKEIVYADKVSLKLENDSLRLLLGIKEKELLESTTLLTKNKGTVKTETKIEHVNNDTVRSFVYKDRWIDLKGKSSKDFTTIDYAFDDSLTIATFYKRKWFFGKKRTYIDVFSTNPNVSVNGLRSVRKEIKSSGRWGIGPYAGIYYNGSWKPSYGIGVSYHLIRF